MLFFQKGCQMKNDDISRYWKRIINTMNDGLMLISAEGTILMVNKSFERLTGYSADEAIGQSCTLLACDACEQALNNRSGDWCKLFLPNHPDMRRCRCGIVRKDGTCLAALKMHPSCGMTTERFWALSKPSPISVKSTVWTSRWNCCPAN